MLRYVWREYLCSVKKSRFIVGALFMLYFSCVSVVQEESIWRLQNVMQLFCIVIIFGEAFQYGFRQTIPRVFFYVPRRTAGKENSLRPYIRYRCVVEIATFLLLSLGVDAVSCLYHQVIRQRHIYQDVPEIQLLHFILFVICLTYFRVGAFHRALLQRWMFRGKRQLLHFGMVGAAIGMFLFTEIIIDSAIGGQMPSLTEKIIVAVLVLLCLLHTFYFSHRCIVEMSMTEAG